jgi:hypothetical protein
MTVTTILTRALATLMVVAALATGGRTVAADSPASPPRRPIPDYFDPCAPIVEFDRDRFRAERISFALLEMKLRKEAKPAAFPFLEGDYEVLGPSTERYNCIAWTIGVTDQWVWPGKAVVDFDRLYARYRFKPLKTLDYSVVPGVEKVLIYDAPDKKTGGRAVTHGAKQEADGTWTSKVGAMALIKHRTPQAVSGGTYGSPKRVYARTAVPEARRKAGGRPPYLMPSLMR